MAYAYYPRIILPVRRNIQDTKYDCGPASLKIILETMGHHPSEETLMRLAGTTPKDGTSPRGLHRTLTQLGIRSHVHAHASVARVEAEIQACRLCVIDYQAWGESGRDFALRLTGHYSVIFGYTPTHFHVADPSKHRTKIRRTWGFRMIRKDLFVQRWADTESDGVPTRHWLLSVPLRIST
ncbi:C39 family peptidase [Candidatus Uhrbacteria bacterium]|nr:C39 family peptidase [Candidatus Uhrbacteria bacterium]